MRRLLKQLLYCSKAAEGRPADDLFDIVGQSERNNPGRGVTGFLLADGDRFLQFMEGSPLSVEALFAIIDDDPRHERLEVVFQGSSEERLFPEWSMKSLVSFKDRPALDVISDRVRGREGGNAVLEAIEAFLRA